MARRDKETILRQAKQKRRAVHETRGRKARSTEAATITLGIRITDDERTMIRAAAASDGIDVATYVRRLVARDLTSRVDQSSASNYANVLEKLPSRACTAKTCNEKS